MFQQSSMNAPEMFWRCFRSVSHNFSATFQECSMQFFSNVPSNLLAMFQECSGMLWPLSLNTMAIECSGNFLTVFHQCSTYVPPMSHQCSISVPPMFFPSSIKVPGVQTWFRWISSLGLKVDLLWSAQIL